MHTTEKTENHKSIKKNMLMSIILTTSNFIFPLITYAYVSRKLLPVGTGKVAFVQSVLAYFLYIAALGVSWYGTRECAKVRDDKEKLSLLVQELLRINLISTSVAYVALIITVLVVPQFYEYRVLFLVMSPCILLQTVGIEWLYQALEEYTYITLRSLAFKVVSLILIFVFIQDANDYLMYGAVIIFNSHASYILNFLHSRKYISYRKFEKYDLIQHLKPIFVFFFSAIVITIYGHLDALMLGMMQGDYEVGIYNAALRMKTIVVSLSTAITSVLFPRMSVYFKEGDKKNYEDLLQKSLRITLVLMLPLTCYVIINSRDILLFVCGNQYTTAQSSLIVLMLCTIALALTNLLGNQILLPKGDEKRYSISVFVGMIIDMALNFILIPKYGSLGAAIATLETEISNVVIMGTGCKKEIVSIIKHVRIIRYLIPLTIAIVIDAIVAQVMDSTPLLIRLVITAFVMFIIYYMMLILQKEPIISNAISAVNNKISNNNTRDDFKS